MATADQYAEWIVNNAAKRGTPEFDTVAQAYQLAKQEEARAIAPVVQPSKERSTGEAFSDVGAQLKKGAAQLVQFPGQLYGLTTGDFSETGLYGYGKEMEAAAEAAKSPGLKAREAARAAAVAEAEKKGQLSAGITAAKETITDPALFLGLLAENIPGMLLPAGAAVGVGRAALQKGLAKGVEAAAAREAAVQAGTRAAVGAGAAQQGADVGTGAYEDVYKRLVSQGVSEPEAAAKAINLARAAGVSGAIISILAQRLPGASKLEEVLAGKTTTAGLGRAILGGAAGEAVGEIPEEVGGRFTQNLALRTVDPTQSLTAGLGETGAMAGLAAAGMGGLGGGISSVRGRRAPAEAAKPEAEAQPAEAEAPKPVTGEAGIVRPEEEVKPLTPEEQRELDMQQRLYRSQQPKAEELLGEVQGQIQTAPPTTPEDIARIRDDHETSVINSLLEQDRKMQAVSDLARLNVERASQTESMEAATQDADRRVREGRLMGRVQSLIDQNIPFASTAIADINRKFELIGEAPLDDTERSRVQNIMTMAQGFTDFVKLPSLPAREQDIFAENQAMQELESSYKEQLQKRLQQEADRQAQLSNKKKQATTQAVLQSIQKRGGIASIDEAEYLQSQGIEGAFADVDPGLGETISATSKGMEEEISPEEMSYRLAQLKERKPRGQVSPQPVRAETPAPSPVVGQAPVSGGIKKSTAIRPTGSPKPGIAKDRQLSTELVAKPIRGAQTTIITSDRNKIPAEWQVVEADSIAASMVEGKSQPRDRQRAASNSQVAEIAQNPDFDSLSDTSKTMDYGAPTLTQDGVIVGGNGRFEGVSRSYDLEAGQRYKQSLLENAERLGLDPEQIKAMKKPILVRKITQAADTRKLAIQSNIGPGLKMSDMEQAAIDTERMSGLDRLSISDTGDIPLTAGNREAIRDSLRDYTIEEIADMMAADGSLSQTGLRRVKNAILYKAYGKTDTLARLIESPDPDLKNVGTALMRASGGMSKMMDAIRSGAIPAEYDIIEDLTGAIETLSSLRASGTKVQDFLMQSELFGDGISGPARSILRFMDNNLKSAKSITEFLNDYAQSVLSAESAAGGLFGEAQLPTKQETVERAAKKYEAQRTAAKAQRTLEEQPAGEVRPEARVQPEGEGRATGSDEEAGVAPAAPTQAEINRQRQQAKKEAAEQKRLEQDRLTEEKRQEQERKKLEVEAREKAKRLAQLEKEEAARKKAEKIEKQKQAEQARLKAEKEAEAKRKAADKKAAQEEAKRKAEEMEAKRKAEEAEAKRKAEELPPYEERVKLSADDLYPQLKDFDSAVNAIYARASNPAEKEIASLIKSRVAQFKELGFAFSLRVTPEGKMLSSGALGHSVVKYSPVGEATTISIALNHPSNGDQSGTRWDTVAHELLHAVTQAQIRFSPEGSAAKQLKSLFNDVVDYFNERAKAKTLTAFESRMYNGEINALRNPDELLAWGLSDKNMQSWLSGIDSKKGNFLSRLYDIVANVLGFGKSNTALAELLSVSETLLTEPVDAYIAKANLRGKSFGLQKNVSDIPGWALSFADGLPVVWSEKDAALIKAESVTGKTIYLVATPEGVSRVDVAGYTGSLLPPTRLEEVKGIADTLRAEPEEEIRFMRSAPPPTAAGQQALNTINQLGMGVKEPEKGTLEKAKAKLQQIGEAPAKDTIKDWKKKVSGFMDYVDGKIFSADAPFENKLREGYRRDMKDMKEFIGAQLAISQSQAVNADAVSTRSMLIGKPKFRKDLLKWEAVEDPANEIAKAEILDKIAEKYGLTKEEAVQVAHTYMSAANYEGILERNAAIKAKKEALREGLRKLDSRIVKANAEHQKRVDATEEAASKESDKIKASYQKRIDDALSDNDENAANDLKEERSEKLKENRNDSRNTVARLVTQLKVEIKELREENQSQEKEADKLSAAEVFVTPEQAAMVKPGLEIANQIPEVKEITALWNQQRENVKDVLLETGLWTPEYADAMMDNAAYVPFYREMEEDSDDNPEIMIRGLQVKAKEHKLKGSSKPVENVFENMARWQQYAINRAIRNHKALQMVDAATEMPFGDGMMATKVSESKRGKNITRVWRDGKQEFYEMADPLFVDAFKSLGAVSIPSVKYFTAIANKLRQFIVLYPMFSVAQLSQDSVAAMFSSGLQPKFALKIPYLAVKHAISTFRGTNNLHNELINFGVVGVRDFNSAVSRDDAAITAGIKMPPGGVAKVKYVLERIAMSADNAVRQAVYEAAMQQPGVTQAEALEKAFEVINFRRRGSSKLVNLIGQTVPFFYAYLSAQRVAYKTITGVGISPVERKAAIETLIYTSAAVMALSFIYAMANGDDEAYEKTPTNIRDRSINIPGTNGFRIPLRPDFFLFPKIIAEHTYHLIAENGFSDPAKFKKAMKDNFFNAALSPNVVPQAFKPAVEIGLNYDFFSGKPIVGFFEQNKEAGRQFSDSTSEFAKMMGGAGLSPQKVDHFIRGYFGTVGGLFLYGTNFFIEGESGVPRPELSFEDAIKTFPGVSALKQKPTENALKVDFYELRDAIEKAKNTYDDIKKRSPEGLQDFIENEENYAKIALEKSVTKIADHLSDIRRTIQQISAAPEDRFSAAEKQERIKELKEVELQLLKSVNLKEMRAMAKM